MTTTDPFTEAARAGAERVHRDAKYLTPSRRGPLLSSATTMIELREALAVAEARLLAVRELHRQFGVYEHEDDCPDTSDEHREAHHHEDSDGYGEEYCDQRPLYTLCDHCRDESGERLDWPCPTIQALDSARATRRDEEKR